MMPDSDRIEIAGSLELEFTIKVGCMKWEPMEFEVENSKVIRISNEIGIGDNSTLLLNLSCNCFAAAQKTHPHMFS